MTHPDLTIVIPTYNEGDIIESSLKRVSNALGDMCARTEIIIADDGVDDLPTVIEHIRISLPFSEVRVMRNPIPRGKGGSIQQAFSTSTGTIVGFIDVDHSVDPLHIHDAIREIQSGADICIASRVGNRFKVDNSVVTSVLGTLFSAINRHLLFGAKKTFSDTQCGFKFFKHDVAIDLYQDLVATDGLNDLEILVKAARRPYRVAELIVPRKNDRVGKIRISTILTRETRSLIRIFLKYRLGL